MLKRLTERQRDSFILIIGKDKPSMRKAARKLGISHAAMDERLHQIKKKGYLIKRNRRWYPTSAGLEQFMNDGLHNRFIKTKK